VLVQSKTKVSLMTPRKALIVGSTGLIGSSTLKYLFNDPSYSEVTALVRKTPHLEKHRKLKEVITNFRNLEETHSAVLIQIDCIGMPGPNGAERICDRQPWARVGLSMEHNR
jgi:NAD dependent epimerase/dehydratase family enzyme